jgi:predicted Zn-dependent protease
MKALLLIIFFGLLSYQTSAQASGQQLINQYLKNGEFNKAAEILKDLFKDDPDVYFNDYIACLLKLRAFTEAEAVTRRLLKNEPKNINYQLTLSEIYRTQGNVSKAEGIEASMLKTLPPDASQILEFATMAYSAENMDYAIKIFQQGRKVLHDPQLFSYQLITLYRIKRDKFLMANEYLNLLQHDSDYLQQAQNNIAALFESSDDYNQLKSALIKLIQKNPQNVAFTELLIWQYLQQQEYDLALTQAIALHKRLKENGERIFQLCQTFTSNQAYDEAIKGYGLLIAGGPDNDLYIPAKIELINVKNLKITNENYTHNDLKDLVQEYQSLLNEFGRNNRTAFAMHKLAKLQAFKLHQWAEAISLLEETIKINNLKPEFVAQCKLDMADIFLMNDQPWEATLLYSQVEKDIPESQLAQEAKYKNARMAFYIGDFTWAKAQLDVLKAATSQLIANDALNLSLLITDNLVKDSIGEALKMYARAELYLFKEQFKNSLNTLDSITRIFPGNHLTDDVLMTKAKIHIQNRNYREAIPLLETIINQYAEDIWADDALFMIGDIYENKVNDKVKAQTYYEKIIIGYPGSLWLNEARLRFRKLRGE